MSVSIVTDRSKNIHWIARQGDDQSITIHFVTGMSDYDISGQAFTLSLVRFGGGTIINLTEGNGLTNGGANGILEIDFSAAQMSIEADQYLVFLRSAGTLGAFTWLNGQYTLNGEQYDGDTTDEETLSVQTGGTVVNLSVTVGGGSGASFSIIDYTDFESGGGTFPSPVVDQPYRLVFSNQDNEFIIDGVQYLHNTIIVYRGSGMWQSWASNYGADS